MNKLIGAQKCGGCKFGLPYGEQLVCRRMPPTATAVIVQGPDGRPMVGGCVSNFPPVQRDQWCGEWVKGFRPDQVDEVRMRVAQ